MPPGSTIPSFRSLFKREPDVLASAPGRVNLIGEHTDYNGGFVLPIATPQRTLVSLARRNDRVVRAWSDAIAEEPESFVIGEETRRGAWIDYIQGVTHILEMQGHTLRGFDLRIRSTVPVGSGLSSSAALEVALLRGLRDLFGLAIDDVAIALAGRRVENDFVGAPVGIMDQMASSLAGTDAALFLNTRTLQYEFVPFPSDGELIVIASGVTHQHAGGEYRTRRTECEHAAELLGVAQLCDLSPDGAHFETLPDPLGRRARHVITENARVPEAVAAMRAGDLVALGRLFYASHISMRDDYEVSTPEIDTLIELAKNDSQVLGARLTGGGFGGSVVMVAERGNGLEAARRITVEYAKLTGKTPTLLLPESP